MKLYLVKAIFSYRGPKVILENVVEVFPMESGIHLKNIVEELESTTTDDYPGSKFGLPRYCNLRQLNNSLIQGLKERGNCLLYRLGDPSDSIVDYCWMIVDIDNDNKDIQSFRRDMVLKSLIEDL